MDERLPAPIERRLRAALARAPLAGRRGDREALGRLCEETAERMFDHLDPVRLDPEWTVDLAMQCGVGERLAERFPRSRVLSCGYAPNASASAPAGGDARSARVAASPMRLPLASSRADLVASNLALFWFPDIAAVLREIWRVLCPGGLVAFTTLGPGTLEELRQIWRTVDERSHIIEFIDMHEVGDAMVMAGFTDVVMDAERITVTWPDVRALLNDLRGLGTGNPHSDGPSGLTTPRMLAALVEACEAGRPTGRIPATVELVHGHGWKPLARVEVSLESTARPR